ncbi:hypothetical protein IST455A_05834 [Burkholderia multivorans]|nr:hypothetical protein IST495A_00182 [Burkholderia multivorans]CAB5311119.1 hypothetical protein IST419_05858 [Burkholderia multivorans]CAB5318807.1 hypothetical protein IST424_05842 [Burkholderia multivorans]CAB5320244.1 hypothetical protein IST455A_05834 [Burkholderia multivorans]CAB5320354.1 hypothetical protein IST453_05852 [Burkholderia multivorans]
MKNIVREHFSARLCIVAIACLPLMVGCGSAKDANKSNFAKAIDAQLDKQCIAVSFDLNFAASSPSFPVTIATTRPGPLISADQAKQTNQRAFAQYDALVQAGLLSAADAQVKPLFGNASVPGKVYSLTDAGRKALKDPNYTTFCAGHYKVDEVINFTEPGNAMGMTISNATYTFSPVDIPSWATSDTVKAAFPNLDLPPSIGPMGF